MSEDITTGHVITQVQFSAVVTRLVAGLHNLRKRVAALEKAAEPTPPNPPDDSIRRAALEYLLDIRPPYWSDSMLAAFAAGARWAANNAPQACDEKILTEPLGGCPCPWCDRDEENHAIFRDGYAAGRVGADFDAHPYVDGQRYQFEDWKDGWEAGRAEWERRTPEPDESEDDPCRD